MYGLSGYDIAQELARMIDTDRPARNTKLRFRLTLLAKLRRRLAGFQATSDDCPEEHTPARAN